MSWVNRILVPVDLSACSIAALRYGAFLCQHSGAMLIVLHVDATPGTAGKVQGARPVSLERQRCKKVIHELLASVGGDTAETATLLFDRGDPTDVVVRTATQEHADLIVMGRRGDETADASYLGNVTRAVAEAATCGVIPVQESMRRGAAFALSVMGANDPMRKPAPVKNAMPRWASVRPFQRRDRGKAPDTATAVRHLWRRDPHPPGPNARP